MTQPTNFLRIPLGMLYYLEDLQSFRGLPKATIKGMPKSYTSTEMDELIKVVRWAVEHPDFDFHSMFPQLKYTNEQIYGYLCLVDKSYEKLKKYRKK